MRVVGWWIDRWRKSTAYTDLTLEEQGAYRNLIDEVYLREDGIIPDESIAKASGDAVAWPRIKDRVLKRMIRKPNGWTNETALDLKQKSGGSSDAARIAGKASWESRSKSGGPKRAAGGKFASGEIAFDQPNSSPNGSPNNKPNEKPNSGTDTVSVSESVTGTDTGTYGTEQPASQTAARGSGLVPGGSCVDESARRIPPPTWNQEASADWIDAYEGTAPGGRITKALRPIVTRIGKEMLNRGPVGGIGWKEHSVERVGWQRVQPVWQAYLRDTNARYASPEKFAQAFGAFEKRDGKATGGGRLELTKRAFEKFLKGE